jgi:hypothetical protein
MFYRRRTATLLSILVASSMSACGYINQTELVRRDKTETERHVRSAISAGMSLASAQRLLERSNYHCSLLPPSEAYPPYYAGTPRGVETYGCVARLETVTSTLEYSVGLDAKDGMIQNLSFVAEEFPHGLGMVD